MPSLPPYLEEQTYTVILKRMKDAVKAADPTLDTSEGGFVHLALAPLAVELAQYALYARQVLDRGFAQTTFGAYLDLRAEEHGVTRKPAAKATGTVRFSGTAGTVVPAGTRVSTASTSATPPVVFTTDAQATVGSGGTVDVAVTAVTAGARGNVGASTITLLVDAVSGITAVTNPTATSGGADEESDAALLTRYLQAVRNPSAAGNKADYERWALEVAGVGAVAVVPVRDGPGTVSVAILDSAKNPASQSLVDSVQAYIAPLATVAKEAEAMTLAGAGVSVDTTQTDDTGDSVKMVYDAAGNGVLTHTNLHADLAATGAGVWQARVRVKVNSTAGTTDFLEIGIWNVTTNDWARDRFGTGSLTAKKLLKASGLSTTFGEVVIQFAWNGLDQLQLKITRQQTDTTTQVWVDRAVYRSSFHGAGKAPIGAQVLVESGTAVTIHVSATLTLASGYTLAGVQATVEASIRDYLASIAYTTDNDVRYSQIGKALLVTGVVDYSNLQIGTSSPPTGTTNIAIGAQEVAVLGTVTLA